MTTDRCGRREALIKIGGVAIGGLLAGAAVSRSGAAGGAGAPDPIATDTPAARPRAAQVDAPDEEVRALFGPLVEGSPISTHWRLEAVHGVRAGAIPVVLSTASGQRFAAEIFRDDPESPRPVARAGGLALFLVNRGDGRSPTDESFGLGVMALGRELEGRLATGALVPSGLGKHSERDPRGMFDVPLA